MYFHLSAWEKILPSLLVESEWEVIQFCFDSPFSRQSPHNDDDNSRAVADDKSNVSRSSSDNVKLSLSTDSSGSRQSSWSSCLSDDLSPQEEFRTAGDSGRDSDIGTHASVRCSSRGNYSEGEITGNHSPGEEIRIQRSNSGLMGIKGNISGSSVDHLEGASNAPIDIPRDESRKSIAQSALQNSISQSDIPSGSRIPQGGGANSIAQSDTPNQVPQNGDENRAPPVDDDGWNSDGWNEPENSESHKESNIPQGDSQDNRSKFRRGRRCGQWNRDTSKGRSYHDKRALEAEAHFTFELAKKVLMLAGGATPSPNSIFGQAEPTSNVTQSICNRSLQLCAFELGLFALGLHNTTCFNWLSRTYSAHVSWISTQALELGNIALSILLEKWRDHLTPAEVASISDRASKSNDPLTVEKAAKLALACLSMSHTLNPGYIRSALAQCKEQGSELLKEACIAVETAARGGGVYPEVLFEIAKHWEYLYEQTQPEENDEQRGPQERGAHEVQDNDPRGNHDDRDTRGPHEEPVEPRAENESRRRLSSSHSSQQPVILKIPRAGLSSSHHVQATSYGYRDNRNYGLFIPLPTPEQLVQQQITQQVQHLIESYQVGGWGQPQVQQELASAYRVGMLALENLGRRPADDQPNSMLAKNPPFKAEIHWLCGIANKVGIASLQRFCRVCVNSIHSPFVLHELALEAAGLMAKSNPNQIAFHLRSPSLSPMVQKCLMNYSQCVQQNLQGLPKSEYPEFVELIMHARGAFCMAPGGMTQFNELLQNIRRSTAKKKDLWQKITTGLAHQQK